MLDPVTRERSPGISIGVFHCAPISLWRCSLLWHCCSGLTWHDMALLLWHDGDSRSQCEVQSHDLKADSSKSLCLHLSREKSTTSESAVDSVEKSMLMSSLPMRAM